jgi:hypothetical protein
MESNHHVIKGYEPLLPLSLIEGFQDLCNELGLTTVAWIVFSNDCRDIFPQSLFEINTQQLLFDTSVVFPLGLKVSQNLLQDLSIELIVNHLEIT